MSKNLFKISTLLTVIIFLSFLIINLNIVYFGDDYWFLRFKNYNMSETILRLLSFWKTDNGRFIVHLLVVIFLKLPIIFWKIFNSVVLTGICYFSSKALTINNKKKHPLLLATMFFLISTIEINVTRQSVYWLTGSFNYTYPLLLFFIYTYFLTKLENKKYQIASLIIGFLSSATMEQSSLMTFGLTFLVLLSKFKNFSNIKNTLKENKLLVLLLFITFLGTCTVILAPSQFIRINHTAENFSLLFRIIENIKFLLIFYTRSTTIIIYYIVFNILTIIYTFKNTSLQKEKQIISFICISNILFISFNILIKYSTNDILKLLVMLFVLITHIINVIYLNFKIYKKIISPITISLILLIGSQSMMIISPILGYRNFIYGILMFATIILIIEYHIDFKIKTNKYYILILSLILLGIIFNLYTAYGYSKTKEIHEKNFEILSTTPKETLDNEAAYIILYKFPKENYYWCSLYESKEHLKYFKTLYNIKCNICWK